MRVIIKKCAICDKEFKIYRDSRVGSWTREDEGILFCESIKNNGKFNGCAYIPFCDECWGELYSKVIKEIKEKNGGLLKDL